VLLQLWTEKCLYISLPVLVLCAMFIKNHVEILVHTRISFLMAVKKSRTYKVLMMSQQLYAL
jgi:hypothetical protein